MAASLRILHVFRAPVGGLFRHVADLASEQIRCGHRVGIICDADSGGAYESNILRRLAAQLPLGLTRIPMQRQISPGDLSAIRNVLQHVRESAPDVVHGHGAKGGAYGRLIGTWLRRQRTVARIYTPHGGSMHYDPASLSGRIYFTAERLLEFMTDAIIHVSQFEADVYRRKVGAPRCLVRVIPNGLRPEEFEPVAAQAGARDVLFLGSFRDLKGIDVLLAAIAKLKHYEGLNISAHLVGQPEGRAEYEAKARELAIADQVAFHDPMPARSAFATARMLAVPSRAESMPYVVLEAIAGGVPVVATNVGGIPEIFDTHAPALVPADDADALAGAIQATLADPAGAHRAAEERRESARRRFSIESMQAQIDALYRAALKA